MVGLATDEKVRKFLMTLFKKDGYISYGIASTTANVLFNRSEDLSAKTIKATAIWGRIILQRLGFLKRVATTRKVEIPEGTRKKVGLSIIFELLALQKNIAIQSPLCLTVNRHH